MSYSVSGKASRRNRDKEHQRITSLVTKSYENHHEESPDLFERLSEPVDNYPLDGNVRSKIGVKCSQTVIRSPKKAETFPVDFMASISCSNLPNPRDLLKRKRKSKFPEPDMIHNVKRKRPREDQFEFHQLQCKQRLTQYGTTTESSECVTLSETPNLLSVKMLPSAKTECAASAKTECATNHAQLPSKTIPTMLNQSYDNLVWGETNVWIHQKWKYVRDSSRDLPDNTSSSRLQEKAVNSVVSNRDISKYHTMEIDGQYEHVRWKGKSSFCKYTTGNKTQEE